MFISVKHEIPEFINKYIIYCDNLVLNRTRKTSLILTKQLQFYEFQRKQLLRLIDLKSTCFGKLQTQLAHYNGPKGKWFDEQAKDVDVEMQEENTARSSQAVSSKHTQAILFGKYIYRDFNSSKLYLLIQCWQSLVVLERIEQSDVPPPNSFRIAAQYEQLKSFKLVHSGVKYQAVVELHFTNGTISCTDFNEPPPAAVAATDMQKDDSTAQLQNKTEFKQLLKSLRSAKEELHKQRKLTQKDFERLREFQTFGCNYVRSHKLEEKQMLARWGDVWIRLTSENCVLGIPLINNCMLPNLTLLQNLRPMLCYKQKDNDAQTLFYEYRLYELQQAFEDLESLETFFQASSSSSAIDEAEQQHVEVWSANVACQLAPEQYAVLLLKLNLCEIVTLAHCDLFVSFEIEKQHTAMAQRLKTDTFQQQLFIKQINFNEILQKSQNHQISFVANTLHQDFLAIAFDAVQTKLIFKFENVAAAQSFELLLFNKFDFLKIERKNDNFAANNNKTQSFQMEDEQQQQQSTLAHTLFYNKATSSMWQSCLVLQQQKTSNSLHECNFLYKFYIKTHEKTFLFLKLLFEELLLTQECKVEHIDCADVNGNSEDVLAIEFMNAVQHLCKCVNQLLQANERAEHGLKLMELLLKTDTLTRAFNRDGST